MIKKYAFLGLFWWFPLKTVASISSTLKSGVNQGLNAAEHIPLIGSAIKSARKFIPGLADEGEMVDLMKKQVKTSKTALEEMQELARSMLKLKHSVEEAASIKRQGEQLYKDLADAKYGKVAMGISEKISGISLNPSDYIPSLACTESIKRDCSFSFYRDKALLGSIDSFTKRSGNFLSAKPHKGLNELCADIQRELLRSEKITIAAKEANHKLIPIYKEQIKNLEEQNRRIDKTLEDPRFAKDDPIKLFTLESLKNKNIMAMGKLVERINNLQIQSESVSKEDKSAIAEIYHEKLSEQLMQYNIQKKIERNNKF